MAKKSKAPDGAEGGRIKQIITAYKITARTDKLLPLWMLGAFALDFVVVFVLGLLIGHVIFGAIFAVLTGFLSALVALGSRVQKSAYAQVEGQPGAAAAVLNTMRRGGWTVTPGVAVNRNQDVVHRAVGKPGIVLIGEGDARGVAVLLEAERKRMNRFVMDAPVVEVTVGYDKDQVPLRKLTKHMMRLKRTLKGGEVTDINDRLRAVGDVMKNAPIPKGPMPKGARMPRAPKPR
ncbi:MAG TPA: DUF4191 domain-containing protein [Sporichthyaceae bacterium]|nr:DUF4191 domain-containing protein [Sporichthyaceae bacterium]